MASPVLPSEFEALLPNSNADACTKVQDSWIAKPAKDWVFFKWMWSTIGKLTPAFLREVYHTGDIRISAAPSAQDENWLLCNGQDVSKITYSALWDIIGDQYGPASDVVNNFRLPNLNNRFLTFAGDQYSLGDTGGEKEHTLTIPEMPSHTHLLQPNKVHLTSPPTNDVDAVGGADAANSGNEDILQPTGGGLPHENRPPYIALYSYIKS